MASGAIGFQVALELSQILPIRQVVDTAAHQILDLARRLRLSGSDLLVEEDLTSFFGRVRINSGVADDFKKRILANTRIVPLPNNEAIELSCGSGPTVDRAMAEKESRGNLATVIQLSLLGWTHERLSLAAGMSYAMNQRVRLSIGQAVPSPGYEGILNTLAACSSQTSAFDWTIYYERVAAHLSPLPSHQQLMKPISGNALVVVVDSLSIIQRFPEDYVLLVQGGPGAFTLIIWAHFLLGLSVCVKDTFQAKQVAFPNHASSYHILIEFDGKEVEDSEFCLLDRQRDVIVHMDPKIAESVPVEAHERVPLRGYASTSIWRWFDRPPNWKEKQAFKDAKTVVVAMTLALARRLRRSSFEDHVCSIKSWQVWDAASVLLDDDDLPYDTIEKLVNQIPVAEPLSKLPAERLPIELARFCEEEQFHKHTMGRLASTAVDILAFSTVAQIRSCADVPLIAGLGFNDFSNRVVKSSGNIPIAAGELFWHICWMLLGPDPERPRRAKGQGDSGVSAVSDFGWTVYLPTFGAGDCDPATVTAELLFLKEGMLTDKVTRERKPRIRDAGASSNIEFTTYTRSEGERNWILENSGPSYQPRCVSPVLERQEYYGILGDSFQVTTRLKGIHREPAQASGVQPSFEIHQSYKAAHDGLWRVYAAPPCDHVADSSANRTCQLRPDMATAVGSWSWSSWEASDRNPMTVPERIVVVLVRNDPRARWLAVGSSMLKENCRRTLLRGSDCCEDCAVRAAASKTGKWLVVI